MCWRRNGRPVLKGEAAVARLFAQRILALMKAGPSDAQVYNSAEMIFEHCAQRDHETEHAQEWNWLYGHASTIARFFGLVK